MYAERELRRLARHKQALRQAIVVRRAQCRGAAVRIAQPLAWLDRTLAFWRRLAPLAKLAAVPLGLFFTTRPAVSRPGLLGSILRWSPVAYAAIRGLAPLIGKNSRPAS